MKTPLETWVLTKTVVHKNLKRPIVSVVAMQGKVDRVVKLIYALTSKQQYDLKRGREVTWTDELGGNITITLKKEELKAPPKKKRLIGSFFSTKATG